jgi:hypothetical protein
MSARDRTGMFRCDAAELDPSKSLSICRSEITRKDGESIFVKIIVSYKMIENTVEMILSLTKFQPCSGRAASILNCRFVGIGVLWRKQT